MIFLYPEDIAERAFKGLSIREVEEISKMSVDDSIKFHNRGGMYIRNEFHLWEDQNPYTDASDPMGDLSI